MRALAWAVIGFFCTVVSPLHAAVPFKVIARTGEQAPGAPAGVTVSYLGRPDGDVHLIGAGKVVFHGYTSAGSTIFACDPAGAVFPLAVVGDQAPDMPAGEFFTTFDFPLVTPDGRAMINASTTNSAGYFVQDTTGALRLIAAKGDAAPGLPNGTLNIGPTPYYMAASGSTLGFYSTLSGATGATAGIWKSTGPGSTTPVVIAGIGAVASSAAGITGAKIMTLTSLSPNRPVCMSPDGQIAYRARSTVSPNPSGIWGPAADGSTTLIARQGAAAPGTTGVFGDLSPTSSSPACFHTINEQGTVVFVGLLTQYTGGISSSNDSGIWVSNGTAVSKLLQEYSQAPGAPAGVLCWDLSSERPMLNATGKIVVRSGLTGTDVTSTNNTALFGHDAADNFTMLLREGDPVPMIDGALFGEFEKYTAINRSGAIAFANNLQTGVGGVTTANDEAIFLRAPDGSLDLILREGDTLELAPGVFKSVAKVTGYSRAMSIMAGSHQDGFSSTLDDSGNLLILATFSDNSTALLTASVPEPTGLLPLLVAMATLTRRPRRS